MSFLLCVLMWRLSPETPCLFSALDCAVEVPAWAELAGSIPLRVWRGHENPADQLFQTLWCTTFDIRRATNPQPYPGDKVDISASFRRILTLRPGQVRRALRALLPPFVHVLPKPNILKL